MTGVQTCALPISLFAQQVLSVSRHSRGGCWRVSLGSVELHQLGQVELGLLEDLDLADEHVFKREDLGAFLLDLFADLVSQPNNVKRGRLLTTS